MTNTIEHQGIVNKIDGSSIEVLIIQSTACSSCSAKGYCSSSESKEKIIEITEKNHSYKVGDSVMLEGATTMGLKAVFLAFVLPFIWIMICLFVLMYFLQNELYAAILSLISLVPYYLILWLLKDHIKHKFTFKLKPIK